MYQFCEIVTTVLVQFEWMNENELKQEASRGCVCITTSRSFPRLVQSSHISTNWPTSVCYSMVGTYTLKCTLSLDNCAHPCSHRLVSRCWSVWVTLSDDMPAAASSYLSATRHVCLAFPLRNAYTVGFKSSNSHFFVWFYRHSSSFLTSEVWIYR